MKFLFIKIQKNDALKRDGYVTKCRHTLYAKYCFWLWPQSLMNRRLVRMRWVVFAKIRYIKFQLGQKGNPNIINAVANTGHAGEHTHNINSTDRSNLNESNFQGA